MDKLASDSHFFLRFLFDISLRAFKDEKEEILSFASLLGPAG